MDPEQKGEIQFNYILRKLFIQFDIALNRITCQWTVW